MSIRDLSIDFAFYGLLDLLQRSVGLIMVPLYTRVLSQQQYGDLDILMIMVSILTVLVDLQFISGFSRLYLEYTAQGAGPRFAGTVLVVRLIGGIAIAAAILTAGAAGYVEWGFVPSFDGNESAWVLVAVMVPLTLLYDVLLLQARMLRWKRPFAEGALSSVVLSGVASVVFVVWFRWSIAGVLLGLVVGKAVGLLLLLWHVRHEVTVCVDRAILKPLFAYTLPLVPGWWLSFASAYVGRFIIYGTHGAADNALLAVTMKVTSVVGLFAVSFRSAWLPLAMSYIGDAAGPRFYVRSMRLFMVGSLCTTICLGAFLHPLLAVFAPGPYGVVELYFPLFAVGTLIGECESNLQLGNQISRKTHWISLGSAVYLAVNLAILAWLAGSLGVVAAGLGLAVASLARAWVTYVSSQKNWRIPYDTRAMILFGVGCVAFLLLGAALDAPQVSPWAVRGAMLALGLSVPWLMLDAAERSGLGLAVMKWLPGGRRGAIG